MTISLQRGSNPGEPGHLLAGFTIGEIAMTKAEIERAMVEYKHMDRYCLPYRSSLMPDSYTPDGKIKIYDCWPHESYLNIPPKEITPSIGE